MGEDRCYRPDELARLLRVSECTVYRWMRGGEVRAFRVGRQLRISREEFQRIAREGVKNEAKS